jgi:signal transduction histidine kinase
MRLSEFIKQNIEAIAVEWEAFAATLLPDETFSTFVLRNGIADMLHDIAWDMERAQTAEQQQEKSEGESNGRPRADDAAERHALARVKMGLSSRQLISEFRALRATVIRLWQQGPVELSHASLYDLTRFNEAVDQALSEAAVKHATEVDRSRELFLGILGHDLRNPLAAVSGFAELIIRNKSPQQNAVYAKHISTSATRMFHMITDLAELTRVRLGPGLIVVRSPADLREICANVIREMQAVYPDRAFHLDCAEALPGAWDADRMSQVLSNLLGNAIQHGTSKSVITLSGKRDGDAVEIAVHNNGTPIPEDVIPRLFDCLFQGRVSERASDDQSASLGLGLYIAREIIAAHAGTIDVTSSAAAGTIFTARLPCAA